MSITMQVLGTALLGIGATATMDLWNAFLRVAFQVRSLNFCLLGRWVMTVGEGVLGGVPVPDRRERRGECAIGWIAHYSIGVLLAAVFCLLTPGDWLARPSLAAALLFGGVTVVFPYLILQPAMGLGIAASAAPRPFEARVKSLGSHLVFGLGLYLSGWGVWWLPGWAA